MFQFFYKQVASGLLLPGAFILCLVAAPSSNVVFAQSKVANTAAALLIEVNQDPALHRGSIMATLDGSDLRLVGFFTNLNSPWGSVDLYEGAADQAGTHIVNLLLNIGSETAGGLDTRVVLTEAQVQALVDGLLHVGVSDQWQPTLVLRGQLELLGGAFDVFEAGLWAGAQAPVLQRGSMLASLSGTDLRIVGSFVNLTEPWGSVDLYEGAPDAPGVFLKNILLSVGGQQTRGGIDLTYALTTEEVEALQNGEVYIGITSASGTDSGVRGQLLLAPNQAPAASLIVTPTEGASLVIGGTGGGAPVDPAVVLSTISFQAVTDPDGHQVAYRWEVSSDAGFENGNRTYMRQLGVDGTSLDLTVADAAAVFAVVTTGTPFADLLDTPVTVYHRVVTTDGSLFTKSTPQTMSFTRGSIVANEGPAQELQYGLVIEGNYPNPFGRSTNIAFAVPAQASVAVEVYDITGRRVLALPPHVLPGGETHRIEVDGTGLKSGPYVYRIIATNGTRTWVDSGQMMVVH